MIRAFAVVSERMPDTKFNFVIASNTLTPYETTRFIRLRALATQLGLSGKIRFIGYASDDSLADCYRAADVFVLTSQHELLGSTSSQKPSPVAHLWWQIPPAVGMIAWALDC